MNINKIIISFFVISLLAFGLQTFSQEQTKDPWTAEQLIAPTELVSILKSKTSENYFIYNIGPSGQIKNAKDIGEGKHKVNVEKLRNETEQLSRDANILIYCGCCPFKDCPNIRPTFSLLNEMNFTNHKLLNLPQNLKVDWIEHGYPMNE